jgi:hypothetical protein
MFTIFGVSIVLYFIYKKYFSGFGKQKVALTGDKCSVDTNNKTCQGKTLLTVQSIL